MEQLLESAKSGAPNEFFPLPTIAPPPPPPQKPVEDTLDAPKPQPGDMDTMKQAIIEWKKIKSEMDEAKAIIKRRSKELKMYEAVILRVMKAHNIGALDLNSSGGRILFKRKKCKASGGAKKLQQLLTEYTKSEQEANKIISFINEHAEVVIKESLGYEDAE